MVIVEVDIYTIVVLALPLIILLGFRLLFFKEKYLPTKNFGDFISLLYFISLFLGVVYFCLYPERSIYYPSLAGMSFLVFAWFCILLRCITSNAGKDWS